MTRIVCALPAEARPIVAHLGLEPAGPRLYRGDGVELIVSGVGPARARAAVERAAPAEGREPRAWINVGIAGHRDAEIGSPRLAYKIVDAASGRAWYPPATFAPPCPGAEVRTVLDVERAFAGDELFEMEAAGFYPAALRCASAELVQVLKIVSDGRVERAERLSAAGVSELIEGNLPVLEALRRELDALAAELAARTAVPDGFDDFLKCWHFTVTQSRQLERLLRRLATLGRPAGPRGFDGAKSAAAVLAGLRGRI